MPEVPVGSRVQGAQLSFLTQGQRHGQACVREMIAGGWLHYKVTVAWLPFLHTRSAAWGADGKECTQATEREMHARALKGMCFDNDHGCEGSRG